MQTIASRSEDVVRRFFDAYLHLRDLDKTLECLADDIRWIGDQEILNVPARVLRLPRAAYRGVQGHAGLLRREAAESLFRGSGQGVLYGRRHERRRSIQRKRGERPHFRDVRRSPGWALPHPGHPRLPSQRRTAGRRILPYLFPWGRERAFLAVPAQRVPAA